MKFTCSKKDLLSVLLQLSRAIAVKPQTQVLGGIYLSVKDGELEIHTNNYALGMSAKIPVLMQDAGQIVAIGKKFIDIVKAMPSDAISIFHNEDEGYLEVSSGRSKYSIPTMNADDFPKVSRKDAQSHFKIKSIVLKNLIKQTVFSCSTDESHPIYMGCLFETKDDDITVVATNMHRLAIVRDKLYENTDTMKFIVPSDALRSIAEMLSDNEDDLIDIDYTGKGVAFTIDKVFVTARLIEGNFPDYNRVIPQSSESIARVNVTEMREAVERVAIISKEDANKKITCNFTNEGLKISAQTIEFGGVEDTIDTELEGPELKISFNYTYIADVLKILKSQIFKIAMKGQYDPVDIREGDGSENFIYVVTPVRG